VTAPKSWPNSGPKTRAKVDYQVAAPTVSRTPTWQRAIIAQQRLRMEGWRLRRLEIRLGSTERKHKAVLTQTGLLMEGLENYFWIARYPPWIAVPRLLGRSAKSTSLPIWTTRGSNASTSAKDVRKFTMQARSANFPSITAFER
jgi:hypothetical protein